MNFRLEHLGVEQGREMVGMKNQQGIALLTVMLMLMILTILGIASITVTSMENRMAGFFRSTEAVVAAADSCEGLAANIIQQTLSPPGVLPAPLSLLQARFPRRMPPRSTLKSMGMIFLHRLRRTLRLSILRILRARLRISS